MGSGGPGWQGKSDAASVSVEGKAEGHKRRSSRRGGEEMRVMEGNYGGAEAGRDGGGEGAGVWKNQCLLKKEAAKSQGRRIKTYQGLE